MLFFFSGGLWLSHSSQPQPSFPLYLYYFRLFLKLKFRKAAKDSAANEIHRIHCKILTNEVIPAARNGFSFVGNNSNNYFDLIFDIVQGEIFDIYQCKSFECKTSVIDKHIEIKIHKS